MIFRLPHAAQHNRQPENAVYENLNYEKFCITPIVKPRFTLQKAA